MFDDLDSLPRRPLRRSLCAATGGFVRNKLTTASSFRALRLLCSEHRKEDDSRLKSSLPV